MRLAVLAAVVLVAIAALAVCGWPDDAPVTHQAEDAGDLEKVAPFLATRGDPLPVRQHGRWTWPQLRTSHGHAVHLGNEDVTCKDCHEGGFRAASTETCVSCHEDEGAHPHVDAPDGGLPDCVQCHAFEPHEKLPTCIECHAEAQGAVPQVVVHKDEACLECHRAHEPQVEPLKPCRSCHEEISSRHDARARGEGCLDCHGGHTLGALAEKTCGTADCHAALDRTRPPGHDTCTTCHAAHAFTPARCSDCHRDVKTLAGNVREHRKCASCHDPHGPKPQGDASCRECHDDTRVVHGKEQLCTSCHVPHGPGAAALSLACTTCHDEIAKSDHAAHGGAPCAACHRTHDYRPLEKQAFGAACASCHASQTRLARSLAGHAECGDCHGDDLAHAPAEAVACGSCHEPQLATAPKGHQRCGDCHDSHAGSLLPRATCKSCHAEVVRAPHGRIEGGCETCHRAHGPKGVAAPPACASCHAPPTLPGLHDVPEHARDCARCHAAHDPPRSDRATCTGPCHQDQRDHMPEATRCSGCHAFIKQRARPAAGARR